MSGEKKTTGRRKIEIKKIEHDSSRLVTFSKRKGGLFKKAAELCVLSGAEVAVLILSSKGKPYSMGHPAVDDVIDRYLGGETSAGVPAGQSKSEVDESWWEAPVEGMGVEELRRYREFLERLKVKVAAAIQQRQLMDLQLMEMQQQDIDSLVFQGF